MEQWVTDKFYSHFPSYSGEKSRRKLLDKDRQDEYNLFLSRLSSADNASKQVRTERDEQYVASNRSNEVLSKQSSNELSKRDVSLWNENMDLPGVFNEEIIKKRNRRVEEVIRQIFLAKICSEIRFITISGATLQKSSISTRTIETNRGKTKRSRRTEGKGNQGR